VRATAAAQQIVLTQNFQDFAHHRLPQLECGGQFCGAEHAIGAVRHVGKDQRAVINDFAYAQHGEPVSVDVLGEPI